MMQMFERCFVAVVLLACLVNSVTAVAQPATAANPIGEWLVAEGTARIRIEPCGDALWGVISWTKEPGQDQNNPDPTKRDRSIVGLPILLNMKQVRPNRWDGEVYNAENGKTYTSNISLVKSDVLRIEGCVLGGLFCGGENWTRVSPSGDRSETAAIPKDVCP